MSKLIIYVAGRPTMNGYRIREFKWSEAHKCYIYEGQEIEADDRFNSAYEKAMKTNEDLRVRVRVVSVDIPSAIEPPPTATVADAVNISLPPPEITWQEAEKVLRRIAPHRLKKLGGRPPRVQMAV